jgi:hypothetical protein
VSFKRDPWLLHLTPPDKGSLTRPNVLVPCTRPSLWSELHLLAPLWPHDNEAKRQEVIAFFCKLLQPDPDYVAEMQRLRLLAADTARRHP